jgi:hypothetical protein
VRNCSSLLVSWILADSVAVEAVCLGRRLCRASRNLQEFDSAPGFSMESGDDSLP